MEGGCWEGQPGEGAGCAQALVVRVIQGSSTQPCPCGLSTWGRLAYLKIRGGVGGQWAAVRGGMRPSHPPPTSQRAPLQGAALGRTQWFHCTGVGSREQ